MRYKLGKLPAKPGSVSMRYGAFFDPQKLPAPPKVFGHVGIGVPWGMLGNEKYSCCVWSGAAHETMAFAKMGGLNIPAFTPKDVLGDYQECTGFNVMDPNTDTGTDMQAAASYRRKTGILDAHGNRHKIDAYVAIKGWDDIMQAIWLFGAVGVGLQLPIGSDDRFDKEQAWTFDKTEELAGAHYVSAVGRNSMGRMLVVTWGRLHALDRGFFETYCDEAIVYLDLSVIRGKTTAQGFDESGLRRALAKLAG